MPKPDDNLEELDPSLNSALDEQDPGAAAQVADNANSSPAAEGDDDDLLNVVRDAVTESRPAQTAPPAETEVDGRETGEEAPKKQDDEDYSDVPFNKHPRFQQLLRQRNSFKQDAERYQNVQTFLDEAGLSADEAADGLTSMALMKTNPVEAWARIKPTIQKLLVAAGEVLPDDLQQMVRDGKMDQAAALEVSRARAGVNATKVQRSFDQQRQERNSQRQAVTELTTAATTWEADRRKKDPNFESKYVPLQKEILFLQQTEGRPTTPEGVREQLEKAYKAVNAAVPEVAKPAPAQRRPAIRPVTGGQVAGNQRPAEQSTLDIVRANRRAS